MRIPENLCMLLPKALKMRAIKHTMALITDSSGRTKCAPAQMPWHLRHLNPALLNRQGMSTHPKMENGSELCHWKGQLVMRIPENQCMLLPKAQNGGCIRALRGCCIHNRSTFMSCCGVRDGDMLPTNQHIDSTRVSRVWSLPREEALFRNAMCLQIHTPLHSNAHYRLGDMKPYACYRKEGSVPCPGQPELAFG